MPLDRTFWIITYRALDAHTAGYNYTKNHTKLQYEPKYKLESA